MSASVQRALLDLSRRSLQCLANATLDIPKSAAMAVMGLDQTSS